MEEKYYKFTHAIVRDLPDSFFKCITMEKPSKPIDVSLAKTQHKNYTHTLHQILNGNLVEVKADDRYPDCCFVEDTCVIINSTALINNMKAPSRREEVDGIREQLKNIKGLTIIDMKPPACLDGGDVLVTGCGDIFVGLSARTNQEGVESLQQAFPKHKVKPIEVTKGLHLKSVMSGLDHKTIVIADTPQGHEIAEKIQPKNSEQIYEWVYVPDEVASNVLRVRDTLIIQDGFPKSELILQNEATKRNIKVVKLQMSELIKGDGALTCCSVLMSL